MMRVCWASQESSVHLAGPQLWGSVAGLLPQNRPHPTGDVGDKMSKTTPALLTTPYFERVSQKASCLVALTNSDM